MRNPTVDEHLDSDYYAGNMNRDNSYYSYLLFILLAIPIIVGFYGLVDLIRRLILNVLRILLRYLIALKDASIRLLMSLFKSKKNNNKKRSKGSSSTPNSIPKKYLVSERKLSNPFVSKEKQTLKNKQSRPAATSIADDSDILVDRQTTLIPRSLYPAIESLSPIESKSMPFWPKRSKVDRLEFDDSTSLGSSMESDSSEDSREDSYEDSYEYLPDVKLRQAPRAPSNYKENRSRAASQFDDVASLDSLTESDSSEDSYEDIPDVVLWRAPPPKFNKPKSSQRRTNASSQRLPSRSHV